MSGFGFDSSAFDASPAAASSTAEYRSPWAALGEAATAITGGVTAAAASGAGFGWSHSPTLGDGFAPSGFVASSPAAPLSDRPAERPAVSSGFGSDFAASVSAAWHPRLQAADPIAASFLPSAQLSPVDTPVHSAAEFVAKMAESTRAMRSGYVGRGSHVNNALIARLQAMFVVQMQSDESSAVIPWSEVIDIGLGQDHESGSVLMLWCALFLTLETSERSALARDPGMGERLLRRLQTAGYNSAYRTMSGKTILHFVTQRNLSSVMLRFRLRLMRVLFDHCGAASVVNCGERLGPLPLQSLLSSWKPRSDEEEEYARMLFLLSTAGEELQLSVVLSYVLQHRLPTLMVHWLMHLTPTQLAELDLSQAQVVISLLQPTIAAESAGRACLAVLARLQQWQSERKEQLNPEQLVASAPVAASSMDAAADSALSVPPSLSALHVWLRACLSSLSFVLLSRQWLSLPASESAALEPALCAALSHYSWSQFTESYRMGQTSGLVFTAFITSPSEPLRVAAIKRLAELAGQIKGKQQSASPSPEDSSSSSSSSSGKSVESSCPAVSAHDPCGLISDPDSLLSLLTLLIGDLLRVALQGKGGISPDQRQLLETLLSAVVALQPLDSSCGFEDNPFGGPNQSGARVDHPFAVILSSQLNANEDLVLELAAILHEHGCRRDDEGRSFLTLLFAGSNARLLRRWLLPPHRIHSLSNDWLCERVPHSPPPPPRRAQAYFFPFDSVAVPIVASSTRVLLPGALDSWATSSGVATNCSAMVRSAIEYFRVSAVPAIGRELEAHLIPVLSHEVMSFLAPPEALPKSASDASAQLRRLLVTLQTEPMDQQRIVERLAAIVDQSVKEVDAEADRRLAHELQQKAN